MRKSVGAGLLSVVIVLSGCQGGLLPIRPNEPCVGTYAWNKGSVPPPYNYRWALDINGDGTANFRLSADMAEDGPLFEENGFDVEEADAEALCDAIVRIPRFGEAMSGGPTSGWEIGGMEGDSANHEDFEAAVDAAMQIIGQERFDEAKAAHDAWADEFELP